MKTCSKCRGPVKCDHCERDAVAVENDSFYYCAQCWLERIAKLKGKRNEQSTVH